MSHHLLDDLVADVPRHVTADPAAAWRAGTARHRRHRAWELVAVAAVVALGVSVLTLFHPPDRPAVGPAGKVGKVAGHPTTVPVPYVDRMLPQQPGALAGLVDVQGRWRGVAGDGHSWRLPQELDQVPTLSDDGTRLGLMVAEGSGSAHYETRDLLTGQRTRYDEIGNGNLTGDEPLTRQSWFAAPQSPAYWSPDGTRVVIRAGGSDRSDPTTALLLDGGSITPLRVPGYPAGWVSSTELAWVDLDNDSASTVVVTDLEGTVLRSVRLAKRIVWSTQWTPRVSPDGARIAMLSIVGSANKPSLSVFSLDDGTLTASPPVPDGTDVDCPVSWSRGQVAVVHGDELLLVPGDGSPLVTVEDRGAGVSCHMWAADALAGPGRDAVAIGDWRYWPVWWWWSWWWKQILVGLGVVLAGLGLWRLDRWDTEKHLGAT